MQDAKNILIDYVKENQEKLYRIAFSYSKDEDASLDIVQEAIAKALKNINKLKEEKYLKTWFYRILINECLQDIKKKKRITTCELQEIENQIQWNDNINADGIDIYKHIQNLNEKLRTVIILRFFEDMKIEEIARITKTNQNTVKSRLYKGLKELKKLIERRGKKVKNIQKAKEVYNAIKIPEQLNYMVNRAIYHERKRNKFVFKPVKHVLSTAICIFFVFTIMINVNPSFAMSISEIPILGDIAKVFTVKEYRVEDKEKLINAKIPAIENTGNTELEKRINYEIMLKMDEILKEAEQRAAEYKEAVIETGGKEEDYQPINIQIDYEVGYSSEKIVSFVILKSETLASAYTERFFYNIDIETGKKLNLRDVLGNDYKKIVDETIYKEIEERSKNPDNVYFTKDEYGFSGIENEYQNFYINSEGKVVIVFEKYEIAPGYMGAQEFVIDKVII